MTPDYLFTNHGSICLLQPLTERAKDWLDENIASEHMYWAGALVIEPRYVDNLVIALRDTGLTISNSRAGLQ
jgi:hypothetical protein